MALENTVTQTEIKARGSLDLFPCRGITLLSGQNLAVGTVLGQVTATGKFVAYDDDGTDDGRRVAVGVLAEPCNASAGDKITSMFVGGIFYYDKLPEIDAAAVTDLKGRKIGNELIF